MESFLNAEYIRTEAGWVRTDDSLSARFNPDNLSKDTEIENSGRNPQAAPTHSPVRDPVLPWPWLRQDKAGMTKLTAFPLYILQLP